MGLALAGDYGTHIDEPIQRRIAQVNLNYILGQTDRVAERSPAYTDRLYGVTFELPLLLAEQGLGLTDKHDIRHLRGLFIHLFFIVGAFFCYRLAYRLFNNRLLALVALLFFLLHPRIYANSFVNSKDPPFISMFIIALYLLERAFRKDTVAAFVLLGIGVGLLTNLRIMGIMLFPAVIAMRGLDLFYAGNWPQRRGILLTTGLFALAAGLTWYAVAPHAWAHPGDYLAGNLAATVNYPTRVWSLFQGEWIFSTAVPPHYNLVWFSVTTPPLLLLLGGLGAAGALLAGLRRPAAVFRNTRLRFALLLLACFLLPPLAAALLGSTQYYDWRHFYFLYVPFGLLAAGGLHWICHSVAPRRQFAKPVLPAGAYGLAGIGLGLIILAMTQIHPLQDVYFNFLVDRTTPEYLRTQYQLRSPNASAKAARDYLRKRHPNETLGVRGVWADEPGFQEGFTEGDYAMFHIEQGNDPDLAFNSLPVGRTYNNTLLAVKPLNDSRMTAAAVAAYRELYRQTVGGTPIIRAAYDVYLQGRTLTFIRENCPVGDMERRVFVQVLLPEPAKERVWEPNPTLRSHGVRWDNTCLAVLQLPDDTPHDLIIGQDWSGGYQWQELYSRAQPGLRERIAAARQASQRPAPPDSFAVFLEPDAAGQNRLLYAKGECSPAEYKTRVTLHIYPENLADLPFYLWTGGFENRDFRLPDYGGRPGGECLAAFLLPDYPIREIRTGQSDRWSEVVYFPVDPEPLRQAYAALSAIQPEAHSDFALYWQDGQLTYLRESCAAADTAAQFFLHIIPRDTADLPADRQSDGYANQDFAFARWGGHFDGKCLATVPLPEYPIAAIRTGQADLWEVNFYPPVDPDTLRAAYAALADIPPNLRAVFDLYRRDNQLTYLRETCAAGDTAAGFFLHIIPADVADFPAERQAAGFANQDFAFNRWGGSFDGKCLATVTLPDYPIASIRTGQHIPGQGELWAAELAVER